MHLSDFDLQQLDEQKLMALPAKQKDGLLVKLLWDLKEARERNRSSPPQATPGTVGRAGASSPLRAAAIT